MSISLAPHFNRLTPAEAERLSLLLEECGEVIQAIGKIQRHGYESVNPNVQIAQQETNRRALERELGDLLHAVERVIAADLSAPLVAQHFVGKARKIARYLHHQGTTGERAS